MWTGLKINIIKNKVEYIKVCSQFLFPHFDLILLMPFSLCLQSFRFSKVISWFYISGASYKTPLMKPLFPPFFFPP